jgi:hypothetical protein
MDLNLFLGYLFKGLGSVAATTVITLASILFAKLKNKIKESKLNTFIEKSVKAAEQLFPNKGNKTGTQKFEYVVQQVLNKYPKLQNNDNLKNLIEGAVYSVSQYEKNVANQVIADSVEKSNIKSM